MVDAEIFDSTLQVVKCKECGVVLEQPDSCEHFILDKLSLRLNDSDDFTEISFLNGVAIEKRPMGDRLGNYCPWCGSDDVEESGNGQECNKCENSFWLD